MGTGIPGDRERTIEQLRDPTRNQGKVTWLRHRLCSQSGMIDIMLLEGKYSVEEMATQLQETYPDRKFDNLCKRVRDHIEHLQKGDARDHSSLQRNDNHKPHFLKLSETYFLRM